MLDAGGDVRDVQIAARHADPRTTMRYDRARKNLDDIPTTSSPPARPPGPDQRSCRSDERPYATVAKRALDRLPGRWPQSSRAMEPEATKAEPERWTRERPLPAEWWR